VNGCAFWRIGEVVARVNGWVAVLRVITKKIAPQPAERRLRNRNEPFVFGVRHRHSVIRELLMTTLAATKTRTPSSNGLPIFSPRRRRVSRRSSRSRSHGPGRGCYTTKSYGGRAMNTRQACCWILTVFAFASISFSPRQAQARACTVASDCPKGFDCQLAPEGALRARQRFLVAEVDGEPVGALSGCAPAIKKTGYFVGALNKTLDRNGWSEAHLRLFGARLVPAVATFSETPDDRKNDAHVEAIFGAPGTVRMWLDL